MRTDVMASVQFFDEYEHKWEDALLFRNHVGWHKALVHMYRGEWDQALTLYDTFLVRENGTKGPDTPLGE